jgi:hypothetical protein
VSLLAQLQVPVDLHQRSMMLHHESRRHRALQDVSEQCTDEASASQSCLKSSVPQGDSAACLTCVQGALQTAVEDFKSSVESGAPINCNSFESLICIPLESTCTCMSSCASVIKSFFECELRAGLAAKNITAYDQCDLTCSSGGGGTSGGTSMFSYATVGLSAAVLGWTLSVLG